MLACLVACAASQRLYRTAEELNLAETRVDNRQDNGDGSFAYNFETSNGIAEERQGSVDANGNAQQSGGWSYTDADGNVITAHFTAGVNGFQVDSNALPQAPAAPAFVQKLLEQAERFRQQGIRFDNQGFRIN